MGRHFSRLSHFTRKKGFQAPGKGTGKVKRKSNIVKLTVAHTPFTSSRANKKKNTASKLRLREKEVVAAPVPVASKITQDNSN